MHLLFERIENANVIAGTQQFIGEVSANEARTAGNKNFGQFGSSAWRKRREVKAVPALLNMFLAVIGVRCADISRGHRNQTPRSGLIAIRRSGTVRRRLVGDIFMKADLDGFSPAARGGSLSFGGVVFSKEESTLLARHLGAVQTHRANARLIAEGQPMDRPKLIRSGWACRVRYMANGRRQILNYYLPGDLIGYSPARDDAALATYVSLTRLSTMDFGALRELAQGRPQEMPGLVAAFRNTRILEEYFLLSQVARIGQQKAYERVAHLLLEFHMRLTRAGLTNGNTFQLPLTQEILGDGLGLSAVHINRTFKLLKRKNYVRMDRSFVTLLDPAALAEIAGYREPVMGRTAATGEVNFEAGASFPLKRPDLALARGAATQRVPDQVANSVYRSPAGTWVEAER